MQAHMVPLRIVVNTCVQYERALVSLLRSMEAAWFTDNDRLIVVIGGCATDAGPCRESVSQWLPHQSACVAVIRCVQQNFDFHGFHALDLHREHELVRAKVSARVKVS